MGTSSDTNRSCYLFGAGPGLDLVDFDTIGLPRYAINLAAYIVPDCMAVFSLDYSMLRYFEKYKYQGKIYTTRTRHSYNLNIEYISVSPEYQIYTTVYALLILESLGYSSVIAYGFDAMHGIPGYSSKIKAHCLKKPYTDLNRGNSHKSIVAKINDLDTKLTVDWKI